MRPEKLLDYNLPLFADLRVEDLEGIAIEASEIALSTEQTLFDQEDKSFDLHFLLSGALLAVYWTSHGREIVYARFPLGAYFGELSALDAAPRSLAIVAKTPSVVLCLKRSCFLQMYDVLPLVRDRINTALVKQIRMLTHKNMEMTTLSVEERTIRYLYRLADESGALQRNGQIAPAPTHAEIAGTIGANREMVSRTISKLSKQGVIRSARQRIDILEPKALREAAGLS